MGFSTTELARREEEARATIARLSEAGCRFIQLEMPDINGCLRGKLVSLGSGFSAAGTGAGTVVLSFKGGGEMCMPTPLSGGPETGFPKMAAVPDLASAVVLPWKGDVAAVLCDYFLEDGSPCGLSPRHMLRAAESALAKEGYGTRVALECELYILEQNDALMRQERFGELLPFQRGLDVWS